MPFDFQPPCASPCTLAELRAAANHSIVAKTIRFQDASLFFAFTNTSDALLCFTAQPEVSAALIGIRTGRVDLRSGLSCQLTSLAMLTAETTLKTEAGAAFVVVKTKDWAFGGYVCINQTAITKLDAHFKAGVATQVARN